MGVYIKGMKMPKNCLECSFKFVDIKYGDGCCLFTGIVCLSVGRQDKCPLQPIDDEKVEKTQREIVEAWKIFRSVIKDEKL